MSVNNSFMKSAQRKQAKLQCLLNAKQNKWTKQPHMNLMKKKMVDTWKTREEPARRDDGHGWNAAASRVYRVRVPMGPRSPRAKYSRTE